MKIFFYQKKYEYYDVIESIILNNNFKCITNICDITENIEYLIIDIDDFNDYFKNLDIPNKIIITNNDRLLNDNYEYIYYKTNVNGNKYIDINNIFNLIHIIIFKKILKISEKLEIFF